jgi:hypothetical protein
MLLIQLLKTTEVMLKHTCNKGAVNRFSSTWAGTRVLAAAAASPPAVKEALHSAISSLMRFTLSCCQRQQLTYDEGNAMR